MTNLHLGSLPHPELKRECERYLGERTSTYAQRCQRYDAAIDKMVEMGLEPGQYVVDLGGGAGELEKRLTERGWHGIYENVDGRFGQNLEEWLPNPKERQADFYVCLEVIEHLSLRGWMRLTGIMRKKARLGAVITTPNPRTTDVLGMDRTHVSVIQQPCLRAAGFRVVEASHFGQPNDSLLAWYHPGMRTVFDKRPFR